MRTRRIAQKVYQTQDTAPGSWKVVFRPNQQNGAPDEDLKGFHRKINGNRPNFVGKPSEIIFCVWKSTRNNYAGTRSTLRVSRERKNIKSGHFQHLGSLFQKEGATISARLVWFVSTLCSLAVFASTPFYLWENFCKCQRFLGNIVGWWAVSRKYFF